MAITPTQKERLSRMCPIAKEVDLGQLIENAEAGGVSAGDGLDLSQGVLSVNVDDSTLEIDTDTLRVKALGIDTAELAAGAVTAAKLAGVLANVIAAEAAGQVILGKTITLSGSNPTSVVFSGADNAATLLGSATETLALTVGNTFIVDPNGEGEATWTVAGTAGVSTGDTGCSEDMTSETDTKLAISVDGDASEEATFAWGGCNSGAAIATQMQTVIRALGGKKALVTVVFSSDHYIVTSADFGTASAVLITESATLSCTEELCLGDNFGASEAAGTGDAALLSVATAAECAVKIAALSVTLNAADDGAGKIELTSTTTGTGSSILIGNGTENVVLGFTNLQTDTGDAGFGLGVDMANATYTVAVTPISNDPGTDCDVVAAYNKSTGGFDLYAETEAATNDVDILVFGEKAS